MNALSNACGCGWLKAFTNSVGQTVLPIKAQQAMGLVTKAEISQTATRLARLDLVERTLNAATTACATLSPFVGSIGWLPDSYAIAEVLARPAALVTSAGISAAVFGSNSKTPIRLLYSVLAATVVFAAIYAKSGAIIAATVVSPFWLLGAGAVAFIAARILSAVKEDEAETLINRNGGYIPKEIKQVQDGDFSWTFGLQAKTATAT